MTVGNLVKGLLLASTAMMAVSQGAVAFSFTSGDLVVSTSTYQGVAGTVTVGQTLPGGGIAVANGTYPGVFANAAPDPSFGVTSPIILNQYSLGAGNTSATLVNSLNVTALTGISTSFPSKSELALNLSTDGSAITFMGYNAAINQLDVSNSNTPGHVDPTNPVGSIVQRAVVQVNFNGSVVATPVNTYSGNNGRAAILDNTNGGSTFYTVGNAGNGSGTQPTSIVNNTGVQIGTTGNPNTTAVGAQQGTAGQANGFQFGYSVTQNGFAADKSGKDNNFRGETIANNTLYVTKGSGGNGVDTVYQVGTAGTLPTAGTASSTTFSILPGLPTGLAKNIITDPTNPGFLTTNFHPFGIWFANASTLYVADEGDGVNTLANALNPHAGLEKWSLVNGTWHLDYTLQAGLNLGVQYGVTGLDPAFDPATDGLRNLTGEVNADGTVTLFAVTSTISNFTDQGADPNELVAINDLLGATTALQAAGESFSVLGGPIFGSVFRGVSFAPVPEPVSIAIFGAALGGLGLVRRRRSR